jgi:hypothetical protein
MNGYKLDKQEHLFRSPLTVFRATVFPDGENWDSWAKWQTRMTDFS